MSEIAMPRLSDSMEEGTIISWLVDNGAVVSIGQEIVEIETDKATMVYEADVAGSLTILVGPGEAAPVGAPIARVGSGRASVRARVGISPLARRAARRLAVDLEQVPGSGPAGRVMQDDVLAFARDRSTRAEPDVPQAPAAVEPAPRPQPDVHEVPTNSVAEREFTLTTTFEMDRAVEIRGRLLRVEDPAPSLVDFVVKSVAVALRRHPTLTSVPRDGGTEVPDQIVLGIEVAAADGVRATVIPDADRLSLREIAYRSRRPSASGTDASAPDLRPTFTVVALDGFEIDGLDTARDPSCAATLSLGGLRREVVAGSSDDVTFEQRMTATLVCDPHRVGIGEAAAFLQSVSRLVEEPLRLAC
jgi:pyruvate dehydrogenase E2 component (dihydrolipoamide acetyltransferase)